jgi:hypothetical protein
LRRRQRSGAEGELFAEPAFSVASDIIISGVREERVQDHVMVEGLIIWTTKLRTKEKGKKISLQAEEVPVAERSYLPDSRP